MFQMSLWPWMSEPLALPQCYTRCICCMHFGSNVECTRAGKAVCIRQCVGLRQHRKSNTSSILALRLLHQYYIFPTFYRLPSPTYHIMADQRKIGYLTLWDSVSKTGTVRPEDRKQDFRIDVKSIAVYDLLPDLLRDLLLVR